MDSNERSRVEESADRPIAAEGSWSRLTAFPILLMTVFGLLWRGRRAGRDGVRSLVPDVPHPSVLKDARLH